MRRTRTERGFLSWKENSVVRNPTSPSSLSSFLGLLAVCFGDAKRGLNADDLVFWF